MTIPWDILWIASGAAGWLLISLGKTIKSSNDVLALFIMLAAFLIAGPIGLGVAIYLLVTL